MTCWTPVSLWFRPTWKRSWGKLGRTTARELTKAPGSWSQSTDPTSLLKRRRRYRPPSSCSLLWAPMLPLSLYQLYCIKHSVNISWTAAAVEIFFVWAVANITGFVFCTEIKICHYGNIIKPYIEHAFQVFKALNVWLRPNHSRLCVPGRLTSYDPTSQIGQ